MIKNNQIAKDDDLVRAERLQLVSTNIDKYSVELGLPPDKLTWAQNSDAVWDNISAERTNRDGRVDEAFENVQQKVAEVAKYHARLRTLLNTIIKDEGGDEELIRSYGLGGKSPRGFKKLVLAIEQWKETHDDLVAAGDSRVIPVSYMDKLMDYREAMIELRQEALTQKRICADVFKQKREIYARDTTMLQYLLSVCILTWGPDAPTLDLLGFKTKSGVWTKKKKPEAEEPE